MLFRLIAGGAIFPFGEPRCCRDALDQWLIVFRRYGSSCRPIYDQGDAALRARFDAHLCIQLVPHRLCHAQSSSKGARGANDLDVGLQLKRLGKLEEGLTRGHLKFDAD